MSQALSLESGTCQSIARPAAAIPTETIASASLLGRSSPTRKERTRGERLPNQPAPSRRAIVASPDSRGMASKETKARSSPPATHRSHGGPGNDRPGPADPGINTESSPDSLKQPGAVTRHADCAWCLPIVGDIRAMQVRPSVVLPQGPLPEVPGPKLRPRGHPHAKSPEPDT